MVPMEKYEAVIGLEVHTQLLTKSKLFCGDSTTFGAEPNTQVSPVSLAHPGTLPVLNRKAIEYAIKLGLAFNCDIVRNNYFARKNYFYPDLPKGYQISQHTTPICQNGRVTIVVEGTERNIKLNRIHLEEDAGKSIHDGDDEFTCIDLNRAGIPLLEIVSEPDMHSPEEAFAYVTELRKIVRFLGICDGNMEEGSMRCDANVSIKPKGSNQLGTKVEVKNLNSIRNVKRAIIYEIERMIRVIENGEKVVQQTRSFDAVNGTTFSLRDKEEANDYRYFPDPDLTPFHISDAYLESIKESMPALPAALEYTFVNKYALPVNDARIISEDRETATFFQNIIQFTKNYKATSNWILGPVKSYLNERNCSISDIELQPEMFAKLIDITENGEVSFGTASSKIFPFLLENPEKEPAQIARELNLFQEKNDDVIHAWVEEVLQKMPEKVMEYKKGKKNLIGLFSGEVKKVSRGKADMKSVQEILQQKLNQ
jgi:aspartyl-tRNA(Asn)/glutamyl-tRNA(Gln) amidotransferase subunit B